MDFFNDLNPYLVRQGNSNDDEDNKENNFMDTLDTLSIRHHDIATQAEVEAMASSIVQDDPLGEIEVDIMADDIRQDNFPPSDDVIPSMSNSLPRVPNPLMDQAYTQNILRLNIGKVGTFYFTYSDSESWRDKVCKGFIEQVGQDNFIIYDPKNKKRYLLLFAYFLWAEFDEEINYLM